MEEEKKIEETLSSQLNKEESCTKQEAKIIYLRKELEARAC